MHRIRIFLFLFLFYFLGHTQPKEQLICKIDSLFKFSIDKQIFPGGVIYASKNGSSIIHKAYGFHTYKKEKKVSIYDLYDLASLTKVMGATAAIMKLYEQNLLDLDEPISKYIKNLSKPIGNASFREVLAHQAGFFPWIPFHKYLKDVNGKYKPKTLSYSQSEEFPDKISHNLYLHKDFYEGVIKRMICETQVDSIKKFKYSGMFFYFVPELVKVLSGCDYEEFLNHHFYNSMQAKTIVFNPLRFFKKEHIIPQEKDNFFRMEQIHGKVDDEGAILMNGFSGNAGLFGNAEDVAKFWQMLLNGGDYKDKRYLRKATIDTFTKVQYPCNDNRRGLGFDKPLLNYSSQKSAIAVNASLDSYGHTGFTGVMVWADPKIDFLFIFLCNRVHPSRNNKKIYKYNIRPKLHQFFYDFFEK